MLTLPTTSFLGKKLLILGEAPGAEEEQARQPFVGASGRLLRYDLLNEAGFRDSDFHIANVINTRPPNNNIKELTLPKTELKKAGLSILGQPLGKRYLLPEYYHEAMATLAWIEEQAFDFIIALGGTALWLLTGDNRIGLFRGTIIQPRNGLPAALATYHPAAVLREYKMRPLVWADLTKVRRHLDESLAPPLRRTFIVNPTWDEMEEAYDEFANQAEAVLGVDIETAPACGQITTISFATPTFAICLPVWDKYAGAANCHAQPDASSEVRLWRMIERFAGLPNPKVLQNGLYDMQYLLEAPLPIRLRNVGDDTNILHHALHIELPKDLGTLASLYLNEPGWKQMRSKHSEEKAED